MNTAIEDYLKLIYEFENDNADVYVKNAKLAEHLEYTIQSVNEMIKRMDRMNLVTYTPYKGVKLTQTGREEASRMIRAHRIWEVFLSDKLHFPWETLHDEAEKLEHATSTDVLNGLYAFLGNPKYCSHGNPIPDAHGHIASTPRSSLFSNQAGDTFVVKRVMDRKPLLTYLNKEGINLEDHLYIVEKDAFTKMIKVSKNHKMITLSQKVAEMMFGNTVD